MAEAGYSGAVTATTTGSFFTSTLAAVACPSSIAGVSAGGTVPGGCTIEAGYSGGITGTTISPDYYTSNVNAVTCPAGSTGTVPGNSGTGGTSGCTYPDPAQPGYIGTGVIANTVGPNFYTTDITGGSSLTEPC